MTNKKECLENLETRIARLAAKEEKKDFQIKKIETYKELHELFSSASDKFWKWVRNDYVLFFSDEMRDILLKKINM